MVDTRGYYSLCLRWAAYLTHAKFYCIILVRTASCMVCKFVSWHVPPLILGAIS